VHVRAIVNWLHANFQVEESDTASKDKITEVRVRVRVHMRVCVGLCV